MTMSLYVPTLQWLDRIDSEPVDLRLVLLDWIDVEPIDPSLGVGPRP